jgi:RNA polymerase sigma-70 factor (ECF subfamily)
MTIILPGNAVEPGGGVVPPDSFADVMARLRAGDQAAAAEVFGRFAQRLIGLARRRLESDERLRAKVDPEDVLQSVYRTFFRRHGEGEFDLGDWDSLWALLTVLTVRRCGRWRRHFHAAARDVGAEVALPAADAAERLSPEHFRREPAPDEAAELAELVERLLRGLRGRDRDIVSLRLQDCTHAEVADRLGLPERTVYRVLERVRERLQRLYEEGPAPDA